VLIFIKAAVSPDLVGYEVLAVVLLQIQVWLDVTMCEVNSPDDTV
jgi:hypothetical protein